MIAFFCAIFCGFGVVIDRLCKPMCKPKNAMNTTIEAILYTSKKLSNNQYPLMLRLTKNRKRKYISLHISLSPEHWDFEKCKPKRHCLNTESDADNIFPSFSKR